MFEMFMESRDEKNQIRVIWETVNIITVYYPVMDKGRLIIHQVINATGVQVISTEGGYFYEWERQIRNS